MKLVPVLATAALVAGSVTALSTPATAALITICNGTAEDVRVPGDLVVRPGQSCDLTNVDVAGSTRVGPGADLIVTGGTFSGPVNLRSDAYFDAVDATVEGNLVNRGYGVFSEGSTFAGNVVTRGADGAVPFIFTLDTDVAGNVDSVGAETLLDGTIVSGDVRGVDGSYTDLFDTAIDGGLSAIGNEFGAIFCESEVYGDAVYTGNAYGIQLGTTGALADCDGASFWGGDVSVNDNLGGVEVSGNIVRGNLSGENNDPAPVGENNRVRGEVSGQFAELAPPAAAAPQSRTMAAPSEAPQTRKDQVAAEVQQRRGAAIAEADAAGQAF